MNTTDICKLILASAAAFGMVCLAVKATPEQAGEVLIHAIDTLQEVGSRRIGNC